MKKMIQKGLGKILVIVILLSLGLNYVTQALAAQKDMYLTSKELFWQIARILEQNQAELEQVKKEFRDTCLLRAESAAYIIQNNPEIIKQPDEIKKVANLLDVDELHIFNEKGEIYAGTESKYWGYSFDSGEQMQFFLPMLGDKNMELCQEITPNTAEGKMMQYAAVWQENGQNIIQIGMEPSRVMELTKKNEMSYIFSLLTEDTGAELYAVDRENFEILGSTSVDKVGKYVEILGLDRDQLSGEEGRFHARANGIMSYFVFSVSDSLILIRSCQSEKLYASSNLNSFLLIIYLIFIFMVTMAGISSYLDRHIISGIHAVNNKLQRITEGDLDERLDVKTTPEFEELSGHINRMVKSLLDTTEKISSVLDTARISIGVYEYGSAMNRVRVTRKVAEILGFTEEEKAVILADRQLFKDRLDEIRRHPLKDEESVYQLPGESKRYVKMESFVRQNSVFGILIDFTKEIIEKRQIENERDQDMLTGLKNRRAFFTYINELFNHPDVIGYGVVIMVDSDNLKYVNDNFGHETGDRYLCEIADVLQSCKAPKKMAARMSGDEFVLFIYGAASYDELQYYIDDLKEKQKRQPAKGHFEQDLTIQFSMGWAFYPKDNMEWKKLLNLADEKMYQQKRQRKRTE